MMRFQGTSRSFLRSRATPSFGVWLGLTILLAHSGCSSSTNPESVHPQPAAAPYAELEAKGWHLFDEEHGPVANAQSWSLTGSAVSMAGHTPSNESMVAAIARTRAQDPSEIQVFASEQTQCYARQQSAFFARYKKGPSDSIERYMAAACGLWGYRPAVFHKKLSNRPQERVRDHFREAISTLPRGGAMGFAYQPSPDGSRVLTVVYDFTPFRWQPIPVAEPGRTSINLQANTLLSAMFFDGLISRGKFHWRACKTSASLTARSTGVRCGYSPQDPLAFIDVQTVLDNNAQGPLFRMASVGDQGIPKRFAPLERVSSAIQEPMSNPSDLMLAINELRRNAGTPRVVGDPQLGLRVNEWWRKEGQEQVRDAFFLNSGHDHAQSADHAAPGQLVIGSFLLPANLQAGEAVRIATLSPQIRAILLSSRIHSLAIRQYKIKGRAVVETMIAAYQH